MWTTLLLNKTVPCNYHSKVTSHINRRNGIKMVQYGNFVLKLHCVSSSSVLQAVKLFASWPLGVTTIKPTHTWKHVCRKFLDYNMQCRFLAVGELLSPTALTSFTSQTLLLACSDNICLTKAIRQFNKYTKLKLNEIYFNKTHGK